MVIDFNGQIVSGRGPIEDTALYIHLPVHRLSPKARCVLHTHMPYATALCMLENPRLEMAVQSALGFHDDIAYDPNYNGLAFDAERGRAPGARARRQIGAAHGQSWRARDRGDRSAGIRAAVFPGARLPGSGAGALDRARLEADPREGGAYDGRAIRSRAAQVGGRDRADLHFEALKRMLDRNQADYAS